MPYQKTLRFQNKTIHLEIEPYIFTHFFGKKTAPSPKKTYRLKIQSDQPLSEAQQASLRKYLQAEGYIDEAFKNYEENP
jgi:hypothetical protein